MCRKISGANTNLMARKNNFVALREFLWQQKIVWH